MAVWDKYKDLDIDDIDDYYGGSDSYGASDTGELVIDTRSLQKDTSGLKSIGSYKDAKTYFAALEKAIKQLGTASMNRAFVRMVPDILDGYVRYNQDRIGFNDYLGGLIHAYYARLYIGGKHVLSRRVDGKISPWGKIKKNKHGKSIVRLMRRRHSIWKHYENARWHTPSYSTLHKNVGPKFDSEGNRLTWMDRPLNWRGRRLKGKKGGKFRYRVKYNSIFGKSDYVYNYYYGRKKGQKDGAGRMDIYFKKTLSHNPWDKEVKKGAYRYFNRKIDRNAYNGFKKMVLNPNQFRPRAKTTLEIYNAAPYSRRVARLGYQVLPAMRVREAYGKQIATMMKKDFERFLK